MATPDDTSNEPIDPLALGQAAASQLGGEWQLDAFLEDENQESEDRGQRTEDRGQRTEIRSQESETRGQESEDRSEGFGSSSPLEPIPALSSVVPEQELPPSPEQLVEVMLFVGGHPLTATVACTAVRGLTTERFQEAIAKLNKRYRDQRRPYAIESRDDGFVLSVRPTYRPLRERLFAGPREARLSQPALDVLSVVAYRQPVGKAEVDAVRGTDSGATLRQLVRLGLIAVQHRAESTVREVRYGTTPRFLQVFGLISLDELPRLGDAQQVT